MSADHEIHPAAAVWPMLPEPDLRRLADDIAANGLRHPIILDGDGRVVDGRNRLAACAIAGVEPKFETYDGDPIALVLSENNERRHMSTGQRAMAVALTLAQNGNRRNGRWARGSIPDNRQLSVTAWEQAITRAGLVLDHAPDQASAVVAGETALNAAHAQAEQERDRKARLAEVGPDLAALVDSGVIDLDEAERRADETKRIAVLPPDLVERIRNGNLTISDAEKVVQERHARIREWAGRVRVALRTLGRMAGSPIPADLAAELSDDEQHVLLTIIDALEGGDYGFLE